MAPSPTRAPRHRKVSEAEAMAMARVALETARLSLHTGFANRQQSSQSPRSTTPWPEMLVIGTMLCACTIAVLYAALGH